MTFSSPTIAPQAFPSWYREFRRLFRAGAGHAFLLTGDIYGVTSFGASQRDFLQHILHRSREVVACYHPATGITFALPSMRNLALEILGPDWQPPASDGPYAAALDAVGVHESQEDVFRAARKPTRALAILDQLMRAPLARGRVAVILDGADLMVPATGKAQMPDERLSALATLLNDCSDHSAISSLASSGFSSRCSVKTCSDCPIHSCLVWRFSQLLSGQFDGDIARNPFHLFLQYPLSTP